MRCVSQWCQQLVECLNVWCKTWIIMDRANQTNSIVLDGPINRLKDRQLLSAPGGLHGCPSCANLHLLPGTHKATEDKRGKHTAGLAKAARQSALILSRQNMRYLFFFLTTIFNTPNCLLALGMYAGQFDWPVAVSTSGISGATN